MSITTTIHTEMRRQDRAVDDPTIIKAFLHRCKMVTLAIHDEPFPYIVPLSYGYEVNDEGLIFYFHGAAEGHKVELYEKNPHVSFCVAEPAATIIEDNPACRSGQNYFSVVGRGVIERLKGDDRVKAMDAIMHHYMGDNGEFSWTYPEEVLDHMAFWALKVHELSAKTRQEMAFRK